MPLLPWPKPFPSFASVTLVLLALGPEENFEGLPEDLLPRPLPPKALPRPPPILGTDVLPPGGEEEAEALPAPVPVLEPAPPFAIQSEMSADAPSNREGSAPFTVSFSPLLLTTSRSSPRLK